MTRLKSAPFGKIPYMKKIVDLARCQFRGLLPWHRMVGSGRQRVPSDRGPYEELLA